MQPRIKSGAELGEGCSSLRKAGNPHSRGIPFSYTVAICQPARTFKQVTGKVSGQSHGECEHWDHSRQIA